MRKSTSKSTLSKEDKGSDLNVKTAVDMIDVCVRICAEGIKASGPPISDIELMENLRSRLSLRRRR